MNAFTCAIKHPFNIHININSRLLLSHNAARAPIMSLDKNQIRVLDRLREYTQSAVKALASMREDLYRDDPLPTW